MYFLFLHFHLHDINHRSKVKARDTKKMKWAMKRAMFRLTCVWKLLFNGEVLLMGLKITWKWHLKAHRTIEAAGMVFRPHNSFMSPTVIAQSEPSSLWGENYSPSLTLDYYLWAGLTVNSKTYSLRDNCSFTGNCRSLRTDCNDEWIKQ